MEQSEFTSAGRLLKEAKRIRHAINASKNKGQGQLAIYVEELFGTQHRPWTRGFSALSRLALNALSDLDAISTEQRRNRYRDAIQHIAAFTDPPSLASTASALSQTHLTELTFERLEAMDESLTSAGRALRIDQERAAILASELDTLIADIENTEEHSDIDGFVKSRLIELRDALDNYSLFGPDGVNDLLGALVGGLSIRIPSVDRVPPGTQEIVRRSFRIVKLAMDSVVYGKSATEALQWAGDLLQLTSDTSAN